MRRGLAVEDERELLEVVPTEGFGEQVALEPFAARALENLELGATFDTLCDDTQLECLSESHDCFVGTDGPFLIEQVSQKAAIHLEAVDVEFGQIGKGRISVSIRVSSPIMSSAAPIPRE